MEEGKPEWLKGRGYLHVTPKIDVNARMHELISKIKNPNFVEKHAFFPLIHAVIKERKYKKHPDNPEVRGHSHYHKGKFKPSAKNRPLHYATHIDSLIFGYYAEVLLELYEKKLEENIGLSECVIAYRKIPVSENLENIGKSTINFSHEAFNAIAQRSERECVVLMFDIKSFFSELDHDQLKTAWCDLLKERMLPKDHFNVFKATTNFQYILRDELRLKGASGGRRNGFDERRLAEIRKVHGKECFFESVQDFRNAIANGNLRIYKKPFVKKGIPVGIPQGLPISAVLANLYLYQFDIAVLNTLVKGMGGFYRRYSDDILIVCQKEQAEKIKQFIKEEIAKSKVDISDEKTETYTFKKELDGRIKCFQEQKEGGTSNKPLTYLGFEFYGDKPLLKSANLAKFYRRMIYAVKRKAMLAVKIAENTGETPVIYKGRLKRLYSKLKLSSTKQFNTRKRLVLKKDGFYHYQFRKSANKHSSNYFSYVNRASRLMEEPAIGKQLRKHKAIFNAALSKHLKRAQNRKR